MSRTEVNIISGDFCNLLKNNSKVALSFTRALLIFQDNDPKANDLKNNPCTDNRNKGSLIHDVKKSILVEEKQYGVS